MEIDYARESLKYEKYSLPILSTWVWEACCRKYGLGGTPESQKAYRKIMAQIFSELDIQKPTTTTPNEREDWSKRCLDIAVMADKGKDYAYGKALATLSVDIEKAISRTRQEEREKGRQEGQERAVEFIRENGVISFEDAVLKRYIYSVSADLLEQARNLT